MATCQSVIMGAYKIGLLAIYVTKKHTQKKISSKNLVQYRYCL